MVYHALKQHPPTLRPVNITRACLGAVNCDASITCNLPIQQYFSRTLSRSVMSPSVCGAPGELGSRSCANCCWRRASLPALVSRLPHALHTPAGA